MPGKQLTHFLCLPLVNGRSKPQLQASFQHFAEVAASKYEIPDKAVRPVGAIHLTIGVMHLPTEEQVKAASNFLRALDLFRTLKAATPSAESKPFGATETVQPEAETAPFKDVNKDFMISQTTFVAEGEESETAIAPLIVTLRGLESMRNASKTSVLFASPNDPTDRLQAFGEALRYAFTLADLLIAETRPLLMHATIVNTLYAKRSKGHSKGSGHSKRNRGVEKLDASALLDEFAAYEWAKDVRIEKVSICQMGAKKEVVDGVVVNEEYTEVASMPLP